MDHGSIRSWTWRLLVLAVACVLAVILPPAIGHAATGATVDAGPVDIPMPRILAPLIVQNRLEGYAYITIVLAPSNRDKVGPIREKVPFLQDAFLRELNKTPIVKAEDPKVVDAEAVKARLIGRMNQILPKGTVTDLKLQQVELVPFAP